MFLLDYCLRTIVSVSGICCLVEPLLATAVME